jgi:NACHT domain
VAVEQPNEPQRSSRTLELVLGVTGVVAGVTAVFQQSHGLEFGGGIVAAVLLASCGMIATARRTRHHDRLRPRQRRVLYAYHEEVVTEFLQELPLPPPLAEETLAGKIISKSAYVPVPYKAFLPGSSQTRHRRQLRPKPNDAVDMLVDLLGKNESAVILGGPGSGKTLLAALAFARMADTYKATRGRSVAPFFLRLNSIYPSGAAKQEGLSAERLLPPKIADLGHNTVDWLLDNHRACIILDGLDELPTSRAPRSATSRMPAELVFLLQKTTIVTCREAFHNLYVDTDRVAGYLGTEIELLPLTYSGQVIPFVRQYCSTLKQPELADTVLSIFANNNSVAETLSRPLMLRMTVDILASELEEGERKIVERMLLTGSDFLNAQIYEEYVRSWMRREQRKANRPSLTASQKLTLLELIAWQIFRSPARAEAAYGSFEFGDLTIERPALMATIDAWIHEQKEPMPRVNRVSVLSEIEERTFLIVTERGDSYRFAHKSFFEYMVAKFAYNQLAQGSVDAATLVDLMRTPFPDEIIDFLRELLHQCMTAEEIAQRRHNVEMSLLEILQAAAGRSDCLMARQQAANLLPIVATYTTRQSLWQIATSDDHAFIRRAIAVGEALHHQNPTFLDKFVESLDTDEQARSYHMGYNRIYYGDQPLSQTMFEDDGSPECSRFFRACIRHLELDRYRYIRTMALATVRLMLSDPSRRSQLLGTELEGLRWVRQICENPDPSLGRVYEHERIALATSLDEILGIRGGEETVSEDNVSSNLESPNAASELFCHPSGNGIVANDE